jgi:hypothetical protein
MVREIKLGCFVAVLLSILSGLARADSFTYDLNAAVGDSGSTLTGQLTIDGTTGDPFALTPGFTNVDSFAVDWNIGGVTQVEWNLNDLALVEGDGITFDGVLGDPVLTPSGGDGLFLVTLADTFPLVVEFGFDGSTPEWAVGILPSTVLDIGEPWDLGTPAPLPGGFTIGVAGLAVLMLIKKIPALRLELVRAGDSC